MHWLWGLHWIFVFIDCWYKQFACAVKESGHAACTISCDLHCQNWVRAVKSSQHELQCPHMWWMEQPQAKQCLLWQLLVCWKLCSACGSLLWQFSGKLRSASVSDCICCDHNSYQNSCDTLVNTVDKHWLECHQNFVFVVISEEADNAWVVDTHCMHIWQRLTTPAKTAMTESDT